MHANRKESWIGKPNAIVHLSRYLMLPRKPRDKIEAMSLGSSPNCQREKPANFRCWVAHVISLIA